MPMLLGTKGNDILQWRSCAELAATLKGSLAGKWARSSARGAEAFLKQFLHSLQDELCYETQYLAEVTALDKALDAAASLNELQPLQARYREVVSAHYRRRQSVLAFCGGCNRLHDAVLAKALTLARERMLQLGQGGAPVHALLVSGARGRREETLRSENRYFLLHEDESTPFFLFNTQVADALKHAGLLSTDQMLWHGSLGEWHTLMGGSLPQEIPEWGWRLEAMTDLCFIQGDAPLALEALNASTRTLADERNRAPLLQLARQVVGLPLAVGRFGRWRLQRSGEHRGELDLEEFALGPLVMTVRVLAVHAGIHSGGTLDRIRSLLEKGELDVELAERLLKAYQCFMQLKILSEMRSEGSGTFCNPGEFDEAGEARFRSSLEAVLNLQKIAYQRMVGQG